MEDKKSLQTIIYEMHKREFSNLDNSSNNNNNLKKIIEEEIKEVLQDDNIIKHDGGIF